MSGQIEPANGSTGHSLIPVPLSWHNRAVAEPRVLVAGATGRLGQVVVRKLAAAGVPVRALARNRDKLATLAGTNVEIAAVDMNNVPALNAACRGVGQIVATANNNMGSGPASPTRIDQPAYQNLCAAARNAGVRRLIFVSTRSVDQDAPVDLFRVKWYIEDAIRRSGVRYVILRCAAFTDIWVDLIADGIRKKGVTTIFGDGTGVANYIAIDDVAEFIVSIVGREEIANEAIEIGGPSNLSLNDLAALVEKQLGASGKRRHMPVFLMKYLPPLVRPLNEVSARLMTLGYFSTLSTPFPGWKAAADRFGVSPRTAEAYVQQMPARS
jgi:NADH dehydrogenase